MLQHSPYLCMIRSPRPSLKPFRSTKTWKAIDQGQDRDIPTTSAHPECSESGNFWKALHFLVHQFQPGGIREPLRKLSAKSTEVGHLEVEIDSSDGQRSWDDLLATEIFQDRRMPLGIISNLTSHVCSLMDLLKFLQDIHRVSEVTGAGDPALHCYIYPRTVLETDCFFQHIWTVRTLVAPAKSLIALCTIV